MFDNVATYGELCLVVSVAAAGFIAMLSSFEYASRSPWLTFYVIIFVVAITGIVCEAITPEPNQVESMTAVMTIYFIWLVAVVVWIYAGVYWWINDHKRETSQTTSM